MSLSIERTDGIEYLAVKTTSISEDVEYRNGDYISRGAYYNTSKAMPLYQKDYDRLIAIEQAKTKRNYERMNQIVCKYFKNNNIAHTGDFHYQLINPELDSRIRIPLFSLCSIYDKTFNKYELANKCQSILNEIEEAEIQVRKEKEEQEQLEKRESAIEKARERYKSKNFLWKFVHKKIKPENQNFEEMTVSEIDGLYVGRKI